MSNPIKHHFVPQCYLKKFSLDKTTVNYYDKRLDNYGVEDIDKMCQINNFYKLSQSEPYYIETAFFANDNEAKLAKILSYFEKIDLRLTTISYDKTHRGNLSKQLVLQYMRTPLYRDTKSQNELNAYYEQITQILKDTYNFEVEEIEFRPNNKAEFHKTILTEDISDFIGYIAEANWELIYTSSDEFYTSDNPIIIRSSGNMPVSDCDAIKYFSEIYYPLNSKLVLHIINEPPFSSKKINMRNCDDKELLAINELIKKNAVRYIIYTHQFK